MPAVVLDSCVVSALLSPTDTLHAASAQAFRSWEERDSSFLLPSVAWCEVLIGLLRTGPHEERHLVAFRESAVDEVVAADNTIATYAAHIRARDLGVHVPDAFVLATAQQRGAAVVLTGDKKLKRAFPELVELVEPTM